MTADTKQPDPQVTLPEAIAVCDDLTKLLGLLGLRVTLKVARFGTAHAISVTPLWVADASKLTKALRELPELRPYIREARSDEAAEGTGTP